MQRKYDAIVIGSGLGGLTSAAVLSKKGKKVLVIEQHYVPGGCATSFKRKDFVVEVGLHEMDGLYAKDMKNEVFNLLEINTCLEFIKIPDFYCYKYGAQSFVHPHGDKESIRVLTQKHPEDENGIKKYYKLMSRVMDELPSFPTDPWKQKLMLPFMPLKFPNIVKASRISLGHWLDNNIKSEELKLNLTANLAYYHDDPYSMSLIYWSIAQTSYVNGGGHFIKGGSQKLSNHLVRIIEQGGGQVLLGNKAIGIHAADGQVSGVCFVDAYNLHKPCESIYASVIIANVALPLVKDLLPPKESSMLNNRIRKLEPACGLLSVYIGLNKSLSDLGNGYYSTFFAGNDIHKLSDIKANNTGEWLKKGFIFVDYSQIASDLAPKGKGLAVICATDYLSNWDNLSKAAYQLKKDELGKQFINRLESKFPGIKDHITYYEVATSKTIKRYISSPQGSAYGFAQTPKQAGMGRVPIRSKIKGLYFAGAWTFPGGGFTGAILSGYLSSQKVLKKLARKKSVDVPDKIYNQEVVIKDISEVAKNTVEISLSKPQGFKYKVGQYAVLEILNPSFSKLDLPHRSLSIVSHPSDNDLRFTMRLSSSSFKKSIASLEVGSACRVFGPMGDFTLSNLNGDVVFLVAGIGITPILPMLKELKKTGYEGRVFLFYSNKSKLATAYHDELYKMKGLNLVYKPIFTESSGRINRDYLKVYLKDFAKYTYYLVGTESFTYDMKAMLQNEQLAENKVLCDSFG